MKIQLKNGHVHMGEVVSEDEQQGDLKNSKEPTGSGGCPEKLQFSSSSWCLLNKHNTISLTTLAGNSNLVLLSVSEKLEMQCYLISFLSIVKYRIFLIKN